MFQQPGRTEMIGMVDASALESLDVPTVIDSIAKCLYRGRIRLREFFSDFDPLRSGLVTEAKFRTALDEAGLKLSEPELRLLADHYAEDVSADKRRCKYKEFLTAVEAAFTQTGLETNPTATLGDFTQSLARQEPSLSAAEEASLAQLISRLAHIVRVRHLLIPPVYSDYQKNVNSPTLVDHVTTSQFRNGLTQLGLQVWGE